MAFEDIAIDWFDTQAGNITPIWESPGVIRVLSNVRGIAGAGSAGVMITWISLAIAHRWRKGDQNSEDVCALQAERKRIRQEEKDKRGKTH